MAGRGSFIESFPLFGYDLDDYDELFAEKLELLLAIRERERVTWSGRHRRRSERRDRVAAARAGSAASVGRGRRHTRVGRSAPASLGLPLTIAIIGGQPERFAPLVKLYRKRSPRMGTTSATPSSGSTPMRSSARRRRRPTRRSRTPTCR